MNIPPPRVLPINKRDDESRNLTENEQVIQFPEMRYRRIFEIAQDGILLLNAITVVIEDVNPFLIELLSYTYCELIGKKIWEIGAFENTQINMDAFLELQKNRTIRYDNIPLQTKDGRSVAVEFVSNVYECFGIDIIQCNIRDNTKRHLAEIALRATARALKMLSESHDALIYQDNEICLLTEYCRIAVETGGYLMAWVGLLGSGIDKHVNPIISYGKEDGNLALKKTWINTELSKRPVGVAILTKQVQFIEDTSTDFTFLPWREEALKRGYLSTISLPFEYANGMMACLTYQRLHASIPTSFLKSCRFSLFDHCQPLRLLCQNYSLPLF